MGRVSPTRTGKLAAFATRILKGEKPADLPRLAADQIRFRHQPQNRQDARSHFVPPTSSPAPTVIDWSSRMATFGHSGHP